MKTFEQRTEEIVKGLSPLVKMSLPPTLLALIRDMAKALDTLQEKNP